MEEVRVYSAYSQNEYYWQLSPVIKKRLNPLSNSSAKIGGTQALFNAVLSWANFAVDASDKSMATVAYSCKLLLEANPVPSEDTTAEDLEDAALFLSAVIHDDAEGALFLWQTMPEGRCGFVAGIVLGMATEAYCLNHPEEA